MTNDNLQMTNELLTGKNIHLRAVEPSDIETLYAWENDPAIWKVSNTLAPFSRFQIEEFIANSRQDIYATRQLRLMADLLKPGQLNLTIGSLDLFDFDPAHLRAGIGILISRQYREQGYASEALQAFLRYTKETLHLHQVYCNITSDNTRSIRLFEKAGFVQCGVKKEWICDGSVFSDEFMYQMIFSNE